MNIESWESFYRSELQGLYSLLVVPIAFLAYRLVVSPDRDRAVLPEATRFVSVLTLVFAFETMIDPIATGPLLESAVLENTVATSLIPFLFVYLGDFRVLLLACGVAHPERHWLANLRRAAAMTLIVPLFAGIGFALARTLFDEVHGQVLWILYEAGFLALCIAMGRIWVDANTRPPEARAFLKDLLGYSAAYYSLWLAADLVILIGGLDLGWAIRIVPNQLYYAFWLPFAYWRFFSPGRANAARIEASSKSAQAAR